MSSPLDHEPDDPRGGAATSASDVGRDAGPAGGPEGVTLRDFADAPATRRLIFDNVKAAVAGLPPLGNQRYRLRLSGVDYMDPPEASRHAVKRAQLHGRSVSRRLKGTWTLEDLATGAPVATRTGVVAHVPHYTDGGTFVLNGAHWSLASQMRLRPGVYARRKDNGEFESHVNVAPDRGASQRIQLDPATGVFHLQVGTSKVPLVTLLKAQGVSPRDMAVAWGALLAHANLGKDAPAALAKLHAKVVRWPAPGADPAREVAETLAATPLDPEVTRHTLGHPHDRLTPDVYLKASAKLLKVARGEERPDDRDHLAFMTLHGPEDLLPERVGKDQGPLRRAFWKATMAGNLDAMPSGVFTRPILAAIQASGLGQPSEMVNPLTVAEQMHRVTRLGTGGLPGVDAIPAESRAVQPSHLGFIDPVATPENLAAGVDLRMASGAKKGSDGRPYARFRDLKAGRDAYLNPGQLAAAVVTFPGELESGRRWVRAIDRGRMKYVRRERVQYALPDMEPAFSPLGNLVPLKSGVKGQRLAMGARMTSQALPLVEPEAPLVQAGIPGAADASYEQAYGRMAGAVHADRGGGVVEAVAPGEVRVRGDDGAVHAYELADHEPSNRKTALVHTPVVRPGDRVAPGQLLARSNYTDAAGAVALGRNFRVAMLPGFGRHSNFEDAYVISESAARKLTSDHSYQHALDADDGLHLGKSAYVAAFPSRFERRLLEGFDDDGVIRVGTKVDHGHPLILAVRHREASRARVHNGRGPSAVDAALTWDHHTPGVVTDVARTKDGVNVVVRTQVPMQQGDKLCYDAETEVLTRRGWKAIAEVTMRDAICCLVDGEIRYQRPTALHSYPRGGRMYRIKSQQVDLFVTAGHRMYVRPRSRKDFGLYAAEEVAGKRVRYSKAGRWAGREVRYVRMPAYERRCGRGGVAVATRAGSRVRIETFLAFLGAYLSEGNTVASRSGKARRTAPDYAVDISQTKPHGRARFEAEVLPAMEAAGFHGSVAADRYRFHSKELYGYFRRFGKAPEKYIPGWVFALSPRLLRIFFDWLMWGDGHSRKLPIAYTTTSKRLADDVQRLCLHMGIAANIQVTPARDVVIRHRSGKVYTSRALPRYDVRIVNTKLTPQVNHSHVRKQNIQEEYFVEDYDGPVHCVTVTGGVLYVRRDGKPCWSGNSNRFGSKGLVGSIVPDDEMPLAADGRPVEVLYNPQMTVTRTNPGAIVEMALGKIAERTGRPYRVQDFRGIPSLADFALAELKRHGMTGMEGMTDPRTGRKIPAFVGNGFFMKLHHTVASKVHARGTGGYTAEGTPARGTGETSAKRMALGDVQALLSHGAVGAIRDALYVRGQASPEYWAQFMAGYDPPLPRVPFVHEKFFHLLKAGGIHPAREGRRIHLLALTGRDVDALAQGRVLKNAELVDWKDGLRERPGGLFDPGLTGGHGGRKWAALPLFEPLPNPVMEEPIRRLLGLSGAQYRDVLAGRRALGDATGPRALAAALDRVDVDAEIARARAAIRHAPLSRRDDAIRRLHALEGAKAGGLHPRDWVWDKAPVIPPLFRPVSVMQATGRPMVADANVLYGELHQAQANLRAMAGRVGDLSAERLAAYDALKAVVGLGDPIHPKTAEREIKGALREVFGPTGKYSFLQRKLLSAPVDVVGRSAVIPDPDLDMDEIGLPEAMLREVYRPFVVRRLVRSGMPRLRAAREVAEGTALARAAAAAEAEARPVIMTRAPTLHRYSVMAFRPKVVAGDAIKTNPFITTGFGMDYDGDQTNLHVPISDEAVRDALAKMLPSRNLFAAGDFGLNAQVPLREYAAGLYLGTRRKDGDGRPPLVFATPADAIAAFRAGEVDADRPVEIARP